MPQFDGINTVVEFMSIDDDGNPVVVMLPVDVIVKTVRIHDEMIVQLQANTDAFEVALQKAHDVVLRYVCALHSLPLHLTGNGVAPPIDVDDCMKQDCDGQRTANRQHFPYNGIRCRWAYRVAMHRALRRCMYVRPQRNARRLHYG